jgi:hypothetical protein
MFGALEATDPPPACNEGEDDAIALGEVHCGKIEWGIDCMIRCGKEGVACQPQKEHPNKPEVGMGALWSWLMPNDEDVRVAQRLRELARTNAPREELIEPARHVFRVTADPSALTGLCDVLLWLAGEAGRLEGFDDAPLDLVHRRLDRAIAFFERGGNVAGFVPTPEDLSRVQRLRALVTADAGEALAERQRLAKEMWARLPQDNVSAGVRRTVKDDER